MMANLAHADVDVLIRGLVGGLIEDARQ